MVGPPAQHCCAVADSLGIEKIFISTNASVLSVSGIGLSDKQTIVEESVNRVLCPTNIDNLIEIVDKIKNKSQLNFLSSKTLTNEVFLKLKYEDTLDAISVAFADITTMEKQFTESFSKNYGFREPSKKIFIESVLVKTIESSLVDYKVFSC